MKKIQLFAVVAVLSFFNYNSAFSQLGDLKKKLKNKTEAINKGNKEVKNKGKKLDKMIVPSLSTFPALVETEPYKEQVKSSGASSRVNRLDQLVVLYLNDKAEWEAKGFNSYKGFLKAKLSRIESGRDGVKDMAPTWFVLPFYTKVIRDIETALEDAVAQNEQAENEQYEAQVQQKRNEAIADSISYVEGIDNEFNALKEERLFRKQEEIVSDLHRNNVGKIVFSKSKIPVNNPSEGQLTNSFNINDPIYIRAYLDKAIRNTYYNPTNPQKEIYKDLVFSPHHFQLKFFVDGKQTEYQRDGVFLTMKNDEVDGIEPLTFSDSWHVPNDKGVYSSTSFIEYIRTLSKGKHTIRIEAYTPAELSFKDPDIQKQAYFEEDYYTRQDLNNSTDASVSYSPEKPVMSGEFTINVTGPMPSGNTWGEITPGRMNSNSSLKAAVKKAIVADGTKLIDFKVISDDYSMIRNELSGIVTGRYIKVAIAYYSKNRGIKYSGYLYYKQTHNGTTFQKTWFQTGDMSGRRLLD